MQVTRARPFARGVDQLMYVGDDGTSSPPTNHVDLGISTTGLAVVAAAAIFAPKGKRLKAAKYTALGLFGYSLLTGKLAV